jgi:hypothetical protein
MYLDYGHTRPRVISQGPIDQGVPNDATVPSGDQLEGLPQMAPFGTEMEMVPTPAPDNQEMFLDGPDEPSILRGPTLGLDDDAPPALLEAPVLNGPWDASGTEAQPAQHTTRSNSR